jgi:hypothetical protein
LPLLTTVTVGVAELPGTMVLPPTLTASSVTMPEQVDSATTTEPLATAASGPPLPSVRSSPRTV